MSRSALLAALLLALIAAARGARLPTLQPPHWQLANASDLVQTTAAYFIPVGGRGKWEYGGNTRIPLIYANLMKNGEIVGWANQAEGVPEFGTVVYNLGAKGAFDILPKCGIQDCKNSFCSGQVSTAANELFVFGGHGDFRDLSGSRYYSHTSGMVTSNAMPSARWYPGTATLPDGRVLIVGGVKRNGRSGWPWDNAEGRASNNPTYAVFNPATKSYPGGDKNDMAPQLIASFPINNFPHIWVLPDGHVAVSAGKYLVKYIRTGTYEFKKLFSYRDRPGPHWSYPQTGQGALLPMYPPYNKLFLLATGGSATERAKRETPASDAAQIIDLTGGPMAPWIGVGPMPYKRILGDAVTLCDGTIGYFGGAGRGIAGWSPTKITYRFKDGSTWNCQKKCTDAFEPVYAPTIFNPITKGWSLAGSMAEASRMRLYHSTALLMPDCRVFTSGSDVTNDRTAELFSPPYLGIGPRPVVLTAPGTFYRGKDLAMRISTLEPITKALLLRTGVATHSMNFDARSLWLQIVKQGGGWIALRVPDSPNVLPPGMYMVVLQTARGAVSSGNKIMSLF